jgi:hypothetical protein
VRATVNAASQRLVRSGSIDDCRIAISLNVNRPVPIASAPAVHPAASPNQRRAVHAIRQTATMPPITCTICAARSELPKIAKITPST